MPENGYVRRGTFITQRGRKNVLLRGLTFTLRSEMHQLLEEDNETHDEEALKRRTAMIFTGLCGSSIELLQELTEAFPVPNGGDLFHFLWDGVQDETLLRELLLCPTEVEREKALKALGDIRKALGTENLLELRENQRRGVRAALAITIAAIERHERRGKQEAPEQGYITKSLVELVMERPHHAHIIASYLEEKNLISDEVDMDHLRYSLDYLHHSMGATRQQS